MKLPNGHMAVFEDSKLYEYILNLEHPIGRGHLWRPLSILFLGVLAVVVLRAVYVAVTNPLFGWYETLPSFGDVLMASLRNNIMRAPTVSTPCGTPSGGA